MDSSLAHLLTYYGIPRRRCPRSRRGPLSCRDEAIERTLESRHFCVHHPEMALTSTASSQEVLAGLVDRVTFHNSENGFCVLRVKARGQRDLITVVGHAAMISAGEFVQASGAWINDRTHGVQFKASFLKA